MVSCFHGVLVAPTLILSWRIPFSSPFWTSPDLKNLQSFTSTDNRSGILRETLKSPNVLKRESCHVLFICLQNKLSFGRWV